MVGRIKYVFVLNSDFSANARRNIHFNDPERKLRFPKGESQRKQVGKHVTPCVLNK